MADAFLPLPLPFTASPLPFSLQWWEDHLGEKENDLVHEKFLVIIIVIVCDFSFCSIGIMNIDVVCRHFLVFIEKCKVDLIFQSIKKSSKFMCECVWCEVGMYQRLETCCHDSSLACLGGFLYDQ